MVMTTMEHLGHDEMPSKNVAEYKALQEMRRVELLPMAKRMKLKFKENPASHDDLVGAIAKKKGLFNG